jgi:class 3 adenylate cyclase
LALGAVALVKGGAELGGLGFDMTATLEDLVGSLDETASHELDRVSPTGTVTIVFTDVEDSTSLSPSMGDAAWADTIDRHLETVRQVVEQFGGTVIKTLGDCAMAAFNGAEAAVQAVIRLQKRMQDLDLSVRIGVHTGDVERVHGDYFGVAVNRAARVASAAAGGEILISSATARLVADSDCALGPDRSVELKGAVLGKEGLRAPINHLWGPGGTVWLDETDMAEVYETRVESLRRLIGVYDAEITRLDARIADMFGDNQGYEVIQQLNGVGPVLAAIFSAELGDVHRFRTAKQVCSWAGLTPRHRESDTTVHRGPITKQGSGLVRWAAIEAISRNHGDDPIRNHYRRVAERRGLNKGRVAAARKLLTLVYYGLRDGEIRSLAAQTT